MNDNMNRPNLFQIATSELSQDAFFTWLMLWADPSNIQEDPTLCAIGQDFVRLLLGKSRDCNDIMEIDKVVVDSQNVFHVRIVAQGRSVDISANVGC